MVRSFLFQGYNGSKFNESLYAFETVRENIKKLIAEARANHIEVMYVQHDDGPGTDIDRGTDNYEIFDEFAPAAGEKRFEKNVNSAFHSSTERQHISTITSLCGRLDMHRQFLSRKQLK